MTGFYFWHCRPVVITWPAITAAQLNVLLGRKTSIESLVVENTVGLTTLSPALDRVQQIAVELLLVRNAALVDAALPALQQSIGRIYITHNSALRSVTMPDLRTVGQ